MRMIGFCLFIDLSGQRLFHRGDLFPDHPCQIHDLTAVVRVFRLRLAVQTDLGLGGGIIFRLDFLRRFAFVPDRIQCGRRRPEQDRAGHGIGGGHADFQKDRDLFLIPEF